MKNIYSQILVALLTSAGICLVLIPLIIRLSIRFQLVDQPNERKVHKQPIPRLGGIGIFLSVLAGLAACGQLIPAIHTLPMLSATLLVLFLAGIWDDLKDISARLRFLLEVACALTVAATRIRLTSLHGIFGIGDLSTFWQYVLTVLIIVGVTNAFNLIDGIDGLAGGLGLINIVVLAVLSWRLQHYSLLIVLVAFGGGLLGFLKNNFNPAKIFMGDGGSLVLGYLLSCSGIILIERAAHWPMLVLPSEASLLVTAILVIPVFDSLRVFTRRILSGRSPLSADKTHIHHLLLVAGLDHRRSCLLLYLLQMALILLAASLHSAAGVSIVIVLMVLLFRLVTGILWLNHEVEKWLKIVKNMESEGLH